MTETAAPASSPADRAEALHREADALYLAAVATGDLAQMRVARARSAMLRAQATELVEMAAAELAYGEALAATRARDRLFAQLS
jgi:hypothetical protein